MKIRLPESWSEITVGQYKKMWAAFERESEGIAAVRRCMEVLSNLKEGTLLQADHNDIEKATTKIAWLLNEPDPFALKMELKQRVTIEGRTYAFIPDWTKLTVAEFADMETYCNKGLFDHLEKIMAVMYRPIAAEEFDMYDLEPYTASKQRQALMLQCPMDVCVSAVVFFCNIQKALATTTQAYSKNQGTEKTIRPKRWRRNGGGTKSFIGWLMGTSRKWNR